MITDRTSRSGVVPAALLFALAVAAAPALAAVPTDAIEAGAQRARNGAGLQISSWQPDEPAGFGNTNTFAFHGFFTKGIDQHLAWENTLGYWGRTSKWSESQPIIGTTNHELQTHLVPMITALRLYPATTSGNPVEPYITAGVGPVLGVQLQKASGAITADQATTTQVGLGVRVGVGADLWATQVFGITAGAHFESASFGQDMASERLYQAWGGDFGFSYRFQYR
jgi:opacity protein-like surface antigen